MMIYMKRILCLRISSGDVLPSISANFMSTSTVNPYLKGIYNASRLFFESYRNTIRSKRAAKDEYNFDDRVDRTANFIVNSIKNLGQYHLLDEDFKYENHLSCMWCTKESLYRYWLAIFEQTDRPLVIELKEKLQNSGISYEEFSYSIVEVYFTLRSYYSYTIFSRKAKPRDIIMIFDHYKFNHTQRDCLRILFSLHRKDGVKF